MSVLFIYCSCDSRATTSRLSLSPLRGRSLCNRGVSKVSFSSDGRREGARPPPPASWLAGRETAITALCLCLSALRAPSRASLSRGQDSKRTYAQSRSRPCAEEQRKPRAEHRGGDGPRCAAQQAAPAGTGGQHRPPPTAGAAVSTAAHAPPNARASARSCRDDFDGPTLDLISAHLGSSRLLAGALPRQALADRTSRRCP